MNLVPHDCIVCEIVLGGKLRNPSFIAAIRVKEDETHKGFYQCVADYMHAYHNWGHIG